MAQTELVVKAKSKKGNGIMDANEVWYNASKNVSFAAINKGDKLQVTYVDGAEGGKFVTAFTKTTVAANPEGLIPQQNGNQLLQATSVASVAPSVSLKSVDDKMSKADWAAKDAGIQKLAVSKDAAIIVASMSAMKSDEEVKALFTTLYNHILSTVRAS